MSLSVLCDELIWRLLHNPQRRGKSSAEEQAKVVTAQMKFLKRFLEVVSGFHLKEHTESESCALF